MIDFSKPTHCQEIRLSSLRWDHLSKDSSSGDHLNSVFEKDGFLYVIAHGNLKKASALAKLSYPELEIISIESLENHSGFHNIALHNIWITNEEQRISCGSDDGALIELGKNTTSVLWKAGTPVFTRGLAATPDFVLIGESQYSMRANRASSLSGLWLLDRKTWTPIDYFYLGNYGDVREVRLVNVPDEAHHGHPFAGLETLLMHDLRQIGALKKVNISSYNHNKILEPINIDESVNIASQRIKFDVEVANKEIWSHLNTSFNVMSDIQKVFFGQGWSHIEEWGIWSDTVDTATFTIFSKHLPPTFRIALTYIGFVCESHREQSYAIFTQKGRFLEKFKFEYIPNRISAAPKEVYLNITKKEDEDTHTGCLSIVIKMQNAISPQKLSFSEDTRILGLGLQQIKVSR